MGFSAWFNRFYSEARGNKWFSYFAIFCRVMLALAFVISGLVKISGERFASGLSVSNPMGRYLEALFYTEYYYTFIGVSQVLIAVLLLIPRTALLGAMLYFPVMLNICILAYAVRFEGTRITTLMLLANVYVLCWYWDRLKYLFAKPEKEVGRPATISPSNNKFPFRFFGFVITTIAAVIVINQYMFDIRPGNSPLECTNGCAGNSNPKACEEFCDCIYNQCKTLRECLNEYKSKAPEK